MTEETKKNDFSEVQQAIDRIVAADKALAEIKGRSFSGRHQELGPMVKCHVCGTRHRKNERVCEQKFTTVVARGPNEVTVPARQVPQTLRGTVGAAMFKGKRLKPHLNKRARAFIQLVRALIPDEYTKEELDKARSKAKRILAAQYGRYGFLPPKWKKFPKKEADVKESIQ